MNLTKLLSIPTSRIALSSVLIATSASAAWGLTSLTDDQLGTVTGQTLLATSFIAAGSAGSPTTAGNAGVSFYKISMQGVLDANINIGNLRLGCSGDINAAAAADRNCDVDMDKVRLTGLENTIQNTKERNTAPLTDFSQVNPYLEFAIRNFGNAATRELVGVRSGAEKVKGAVGIGDRGTGGYNNDGTPKLNNNYTDTTVGQTGINRLSGYMDLWLGEGTRANNIFPLCTNTACLTQPRSPLDSFNAGIGVSPVDYGCSNADGTCPAQDGWAVIEAFENGRGVFIQPGTACVRGIGLFAPTQPCETGFRSDAIAAGTNIFKGYYSARSTNLTIGPITSLPNIINRVFDSGKKNIETTTVRVILDTKSVHYIQVGTRGNDNGNFNTYSSEYNIAVSKLGNRTLAAPAGNAPTDAVNRRPADDSSWLKWFNPGEADAARRWKAVPLGFSMNFGRVVSADYISATIGIATANSSNVATLNNLDQLQIPTDNCFGGLSFC